ncbi:MAG: nuclear transport factor 2 family protein [Ignavibacteria bacterium]|nr:nuclear transport factor 2 family protein [Ignavibacteria bacterium]
MDRIKWIESIGKAIDSLDADKFVEFLSDDCVFRFGNQPEVNGKIPTRDYVAGFFGMIGGSAHKVLDFWEKGNTVVWQGEVTYTRLDGKKVDVGFVNIFHLNGSLIEDYLIYIDNAPLFA